MAFQIESQGWVYPGEADEWVTCLRKPEETLEETLYKLNSLIKWDLSTNTVYLYRVVEV
jgi:hypothetical protein